MTKRLAAMLVLALALNLVAAWPKDEAKKKATDKEKKTAQSKKEAPAAKEAGKEKEKEKENGKEKEKAGDAAAGGQDVFDGNCALCHFADSTDKRIGPGLKGLFHREKLFDGRPVNEDNVRDLVLNGGGKMVPFKDKLESKEMDDLIAYLKTL